MITCTKKGCNNYKQELEGTPETCPVCGEKTEEIKATSNTNLGAIACIIGFIGIAFQVSGFRFNPFLGWMGYALPVAGLVTAIFSKNKIAILITSLIIAIVILFLIFFMGDL